MIKAVATRTDFLVRSVVRTSRTRKSDTSNDTDDLDGRLLADRENLVRGNRKNEHAHSVRFSRTMI